MHSKHYITCMNIITHVLLTVDMGIVKSSNKLEANLNMKGVSFFYSPCISVLLKRWQICRQNRRRKPTLL